MRYERCFDILCRNTDDAAVLFLSSVQMKMQLGLIRDLREILCRDASRFLPNHGNQLLLRRQ